MPPSRRIGLTANSSPRNGGRYRVRQARGVMPLLIPKLAPQHLRDSARQCRSMLLLREGHAASRPRSTGSAAADPTRTSPCAALETASLQLYQCQKRRESALPLPLPEGQAASRPRPLGSAVVDPTQRPPCATLQAVRLRQCQCRASGGARCRMPAAVANRGRSYARSNAAQQPRGGGSGDARRLPPLVLAMLLSPRTPSGSKTSFP